MSEIRACAALVAHVLHTPVTALEDATVEDVLDWADDAAELAAKLAAQLSRRR